MPHGLHVPEDVVHLILEHIILQHDRTAFHTAALISSTFLYVAQRHLYRSCKINIADPTAAEDIATLLDIINRQPYISTFIKDFAIIDLPSSVKKLRWHNMPQGQKCEKRLLSCSPRRHSHQNFIDIFSLNKENLLPRLCRVLPSLSALNFSFQLDWRALHEDVKYSLNGLFGLEYLVTARLDGVVNLPSSLSSTLFNFQELEFNNSQFAPFSRAVSLHNGCTTGVVEGRHHMRSLSMQLGRERTNFEEAIGHLEISVLRVSLAINGCRGVRDTAIVLGKLGRSIKELSLSTIELDLGYVEHQPPKNPFLHPSGLLPRINPHHIAECFWTDECHRLPTTPMQYMDDLTYVTSDDPSWFMQLMSPLRPRFHLPSIKSLQKLRFDVSHWRSAIATEANGELFWMISWLAELPLETAENMRELTINVRVGNDFCLDNAYTMNELVGYQGWTLLDMIVGHPNWRSLEKVAINIRSRSTCVCGVEEKFRILLEWLKKSTLPLLNARGIVDVTYVPLEST